MMNDASSNPSTPTPRRRPLLLRFSIAVGMLVLLGWGGCQLTARSVRSGAQETVRQARQLLSAGDPVAAQNRLKRLLWFEPQHAEALIILGQSLQARGKFAEAIEAFGRVPAASPVHRQSHLGLAMTLLLDSQVERAEDEFVRHLRLYPDAKDARDELRWLYFNEMRTREVISLLEDGLRRNPDDLTPLPELLNSEYHHQVPYEGIRYLQQLEQQRPGQPPVLLALGYCHWQMGNIDVADRTLRRALAARPDDPHTRFVVAGFLAERGQVDAAETVLLRQPRGGDNGDAEKLLREDDRYWSLKSRFAETRGQTEAALACLERALQIRAFDREYVVRKASLLRLLGRTAEGATASQRAAGLERMERELIDLTVDGSHLRPTVESSRRIAALCRQLGKDTQAAGWDRVTERLQRVKTSGRSSLESGPGHLP